MSVFDLQTRSTTLATQLGSSQYFLEAARELLSFDNLSSIQFRRHSRKIIRLIEIARKTLADSGVPIYPFLSCPPNTIPFQVVYVDLLLMLDKRRNDADNLLEARMRQLLSPLRSVVVKSSSSPEWLTPTHIWTSITNEQSQSMTEAGPSNLVSTATPTHPTSSKLMPPPDALPSPITPGPTRRPHGRRKRHQLWSLTEVRTQKQFATAFRQSSHLPRRPVTEVKQELENTPATALPRPFCPPQQRQRFGIFCTGKMHQYREQTKHVRTSPLKE